MAHKAWERTAAWTAETAETASATRNTSAIQSASTQITPRGGREALGCLNFTHDAIHWRRNQQGWIRLHIQGASCMMVETVTTLGTPKPMSHQELFLLMVAIYWMLKQRVCENMHISWTRKRADQMHTFSWEATLMVPTTAGRQPVHTAGTFGEQYHMWFAKMPEVLRHFQLTLFHACDPISGDATCFLYMLLILPSLRQYQRKRTTCLVTGAAQGVLSPRVDIPLLPRR